MRSHCFYVLLAFFGFSTLFTRIGFAQKNEKAIRLYSLGAHENAHPMAAKVKSLYPVLLHDASISNIAKARTEEITLQIPLDKSNVKEITFHLSISVPSTVITATTGKKTVSVDPGLHYRASGKGWLAALSLIKDAKGKNQLIGMYSEDGKGNWVIGKSASIGKHFIYNDRDMPARNPFKCGTDDLEENLKKLSKPVFIPKDEGTTAAGGTCKSVKMFVEADYKSYVDNGRSVPATVAWIYSVFNVVGIVFENENIALEVTETYVNTRPDNYSDNASDEVLFSFVDSIPLRNITANLAHLLSTENTGLGGIAFLDVYCNAGGSNSGFSNCDFEFLQLPTYSWTIGVITHELGHNMGSRHTHSCSWELSPGVFGAIDSCWSTEGGCYTGPNTGRVGTIMSYCHLTGRIDLSLGFGPLPGALITSNYNNATCFTPGNFLSGLTVPSAATVCQGNNVSITPSLIQGATYSWIGPNNYTSQQRVLSLNNLQANQAGTYYLTVSKGGCSASPRPVFLNLDCIPVEAVSQPLACAGQLASLPYSTTYPNSGNQTFYVELSNAAGQFSGTNFIDTITAAAATGTLNFQLPASVTAGSGYKVRLRTPSPLRIGSAVPVAFIIGTRLTAPTGAGASRATTGPLTISASAINSTISWYAFPQGGAVLGQGNSFTTPSLTATKTYYAESNPGQKFSEGEPNRNALQGGNLTNFAQGLYFTVLAPMRIDSFTVYPNTAGNVTITITRITTQDRVFSRTVSVSAASQGVKIPVMATLPAGNYVITPSGSTVSALFRATNASGYPYTVPGLMSIDSSTANNFSLTYYYYFFNWRVTKYGCPSLRTPVIATIAAACTPPATPSATNVSRCGPGTVALTAAGAQVGQSYRWYSVPAGGVNLTSTASLTTPSLTRTDTFYVSLVITANSTCESTRKMVIATVNPIPAIPNATDNARCGPGTIAFTASGGTAGQMYSWFNIPTGGIAVGNSTSFATPSLTRTDTFYVALSTATCSSVRKMVIATVNPIPATPVIALSGDSLTATPNVPGATYLWYANTVIIPGQNRRALLILGRPVANYTVLVVAQACSSAVSAPFIITGLGKQAGTNPILNAYPSPFTQTLTVDLSQQVDDLTVNDPLGRQVLSRKNVAAGTISIPASHLAKGVYIISATLPNGDLIRIKAVKQ